MPQPIILSCPDVVSTFHGEIFSFSIGMELVSPMDLVFKFSLAENSPCSFEKSGKKTYSEDHRDQPEGTYSFKFYMKIACDSPERPYTTRMEIKVSNEENEYVRRFCRIILRG